MPLKRQWFKPGRRVEQIGRLATHPFFAHRAEAPGATAGRRPRLVSLAESVGALFSIALSLVLLLAIAALVFAFVSETRRQAIYLDPVDVPEDLAKRGYTPAVVTDRLLDRVHAIQGGATTFKPRQGVDTNAAQVDIQVPVGAISMKALVRYVRNMLDLPEQHLGGEITREGDRLTLLLRLRDRQHVTVVAEGIVAGSVDALVKEGGEAIVRAIDPYVLASYRYSQEDADQRFERTLGEIQWVLSHPPATDDAWALNLWGNVLLAQGDRKAARAKFEQSIALDPAGSPAYANLFQLLQEIGERGAALALLDRAAALPHPAPTVLTGIADAYASLGKHDLALATYQRAANLDPASAGPRLSLAVTYFQMRRYDEAERAAQEAIDRQPVPLAYLIAMGVALDRGRLEDVRIRAEQVKAIAAPTTAALADAYVRLAEHRYPEAVALFERAVTGTGSIEPYAWYGYGRALAGEGRYADAIERYQHALSLMPMVEALTDRGVALAALGRGDDALASFAEAEKVGPRYARLYEQWARVLEKTGHAADAPARHAKAEALAREQRAAIDN